MFHLNENQEPRFILESTETIFICLVWVKSFINIVFSLEILFINYHTQLLSVIPSKLFLIHSLWNLNSLWFNGLLTLKAFKRSGSLLRPSKFSSFPSSSSSSSSSSLLPVEEVSSVTLTSSRSVLGLWNKIRIIFIFPDYILFHKTSREVQLPKCARGFLALVISANT